MILLRRWQRYVRYLAAVICIAIMITLVKHSDLGDGTDYDEYYEYKSSGRKGAARIQKLTSHGEFGVVEDLQWLPTLKRQGWGKTLPVVVVEEHYEVLHYWFQAAELGLIAKSGNTLVHFDSHPSIDMPEVSGLLSRFQYPKSWKEVKSLMQTSDNFIVAAAQAGLLNHIIWVLPGWANAGPFPDSANIWFKFGTLMRRAPGDHNQNFCSCWVHMSLASDETMSDRAWGDNQPSDDHNDWHCQANEFTPLTEELSVSEINLAQCSVHTSGVFQLVSQSEAADTLKHLDQNEDGSSGHHKVLLDIDEDFFGFWSDSFDLNTAGLNQDETEILSGLVSDVFCAETTFDERIGDMFYAALINLLVNIKLQSCEMNTGKLILNPRRRKCYTSLEMSNLLIEKIPKMMKFLGEVGEADHILCTQSQSSTLLQNLVLFLQNFSVKQLRHLAWIGICFDMSPSSIYFRPPLPLKLCQGHSNSNQTLEQFFYPSGDEIESTSDDLKGILSSLPYHPSLVTLSRSVREGFTPKHLVHDIESKVLDGLKAVFKGYHSESIHFDSNLLGGKLGWPRRFPSWNNKLLDFLSVQVVADHYQFMDP